MALVVPGGTAVFPFWVAAEPADVWRALTDPARTPAYLHGMALHSDWEPSSVVHACYQGKLALSGEVLCARPPDHLTYSLASPGASPVYLTWQLRPGSGGTVGRLSVDEVETAGGPDDTEDTWLPVLDAFRRAVRTQPA